MRKCLVTLYLLLLLSACKSPPEDLRPQRWYHLAVILSSSHPAIQPDFSEQLAALEKEFSQIYIKVYSKSAVDLGENYKLKRKQMREVIDENFHAMIFFDNELMELGPDLQKVKDAGVLVIHCGLLPEPKENISVNIQPYSLDTFAQQVEVMLRANQPRFSAGKTLVLLGPDNLSYTRQLYRKIQPVLLRYQDRLQRVEFLNPYSLESVSVIRSAIKNSPELGNIMALNPLLLNLAAQELQRLGSPTQIFISGLAWRPVGASLLNSQSLRNVIWEEESVMLYVGVHVSFALLTGERQARAGETFLLGRYGRRELNPNLSIDLRRAQLIQYLGN